MAGLVPAIPLRQASAHLIGIPATRPGMNTEKFRQKLMAEIRVPTLGESVTEATIGKWFKKPGEAVAVDEPLVELETDKVTIEVPAPAAGVLSEIAVKDGETVAVGALLGQIKEGAGAPVPKRPEAPTGQPHQKTATTTPIGAADEEPRPRVPPKADAEPKSKLL